MLLEALVERASTLPAIPPPGYQKLVIRYIIRLAPDGAFLGCEDTADPDQKRRGVEHMAPHVKRSMAIVPKLLADTGEYVLGIPRHDPSKPPNTNRVAAQRAAFAQLVNDCAEATGEPSVRAVASFLTKKAPAPEQLGTEFDASAPMTFRVDQPGVPEGVLPVALPKVQAFWARRQAPVAAADGIMTCIVCGTVGPVLKRHPLKIKGIPGGRVVKDLVSVNAVAFESYGLAASQNAPTCRTCAEAYGNALNALLADRTTSLWTKELAFALWADAGEQGFGPTVIGLLVDPQAHREEVRELLSSHLRGGDRALPIEPARFSVAAFGASGGRVVVKDWIETTVSEAKRRLARYVALQEMVQWNGAPGAPVPLFWLANATVYRRGTPPPIVSRSLVRLAIAGDPLPLQLLYLAVRQNRAEQTVSRERAMLIKMVLGSREHGHTGEMTAMAELDPTDRRPAYLCGRLLATLDRIQRVALGWTSTTVVDRFYGTASSSPASVFGTLLPGARHHLGRIRREKPGAHAELERQLEDVLASMQAFPATLTLEEQGLFALGFYHQRAAARARTAANRGKRDGSGEPGVEGPEMDVEEREAQELDRIASEEDDGNGYHLDCQ